MQDLGGGGGFSTYLPEYGCLIIVSMALYLQSQSLNAAILLVGMPQKCSCQTMFSRLLKLEKAPYQPIWTMTQRTAHLGGGGLGDFQASRCCGSKGFLRVRGSG